MGAAHTSIHWRKPILFWCALLGVWCVTAAAQTSPQSTAQPNAAFPGAELVLQTGHFTDVRRIAFAPNGKWLATGSEGDVLLWETSSGRILRNLTPDGQGPATHLGISPRGDRIGVVSAGSVTLWDAATGRKLPIPSMIPNSVVTLSPDMKLAVSHDLSGITRIWDLGNGRLLRSLSHLGSSASSIDRSAFSFAFSANQRFIASFSRDQNGKPAAVIWDLASGRDKRIPTGHLSLHNTLALSQDGRYLATSATDLTIKVWDVATGKLLRELHGHQERIIQPSPGIRIAARNIPALEFSPDGKYLASGGDDLTVRIWECSTGRQIHNLQVSGSSAHAVAFSPNGRIIAASGRSSPQLWNVTLGKQLGNGFAGSVTRITSLHVNPSARSGKWLATATLDGSVQVWETATGRQTYALKGHEKSVNSVTISSDERWLASGGDDGVRVWDLSIGQQAASFSHDNRAVHSLAFNPSGTLLAVGGGNNVRLWKVPSFTLERTLQAPAAIARGWVSALALSPDGQKLVVQRSWLVPRESFNRHSVEVWDLPSSAPPRLLLPEALGLSYALTFLPDGRRIAFESENGVAIWDVIDNQQTAFMKSQYPNVLTFVGIQSPGWSAHGFAVSPDARRLFAAAGTRVASWDLATGKELLPFSGHASAVKSVGFKCSEGDVQFPCSSYVALSGSEDGTIRVWDGASGRHLATLVSLLGSEDWLVVTPDGLFDGTPSAWQRILWRFGGNTFDVAPIESFFNEYYRPGLLAEIFAGERPRAPQDLSRVDRRTPQVALSLVNPAIPGPQAGSERLARIRVSVRQSPPDANHAKGSGARDIRLFRNGSLVKIWHGEQMAASGSTILETPVRLLAGRNSLTAYAFNRDNVKSEDAQLTVTGAESLARAPVAHVLSVGVSRYANPEFNLTFAHSDAERFAAAMESELKRLDKYSAIQVTRLLNEKATKKNVLDTLESIARTSQPEDSVFLYFSGHGSAAGPRFYFVPHDLGYIGYRDPMAPDGLETIQRHSVSDLDLQRVLEKLDAATMVLVIDACNSGQALEAPELSTSNANDVKAAQLRRQLFYRGPMNAKGLGQLAYEKGMYVLTGAQSYQAAVEVALKGSGLMTFALIQEALTDRKAAKVTGGQVTLTDWLVYPTLHVPIMQKEAMLEGQKANKSISFMDDSKLPIEERGIQRPRLFYRREAESRPPIIAGVKSP